MKTSLKHLFRTPGKTLLFFLLMAFSTLLLVFGSVMAIQAERRIEAAEQEFSTVGTVEQKPALVKSAALWNTCLDAVPVAPVNVYNQLLSPEILNIPGVEYISPPENRPYYLSKMPETIHMCSEPYKGSGFGGRYILEFTPLEDQTEPSQAVTARVEKILFQLDYTGRQDIDLEDGEGNTFQLCNHYWKDAPALHAGKRYIADIGLDISKTGVWEFSINKAPHSTQYDKDGNAMKSEVLEMANPLFQEGESYVHDVPDLAYYDGLGRTFPVYVEEVTEDFYEEGGRGWLWLNMAKLYESTKRGLDYFTVLPTNDLELLTTFHEKQARIVQGRKITEEEFAAGARVCMVSDELLKRNILSVGDKLPLSLVCSAYGSPPWNYSGLNAQGELFDPFWEAEYEIVGTFEVMSPVPAAAGLKELDQDMFLIPQKSVEASDENNIVQYGVMNAVTTSFRIPNGTIEEFDRKLREAVPKYEELTISYDDNGYSDVMTSLKTAKMAALLLVAVGAAATAAIIILLLYFFIVKQKKRTAIERSLGMSRRQCRTSLVAGIMALTIAASVLGGAGGAALMEYAQPVPTGEETVNAEGYNITFSVWAKSLEAREEINLDVPAPIAAYLAAPLALILAVLILALLFAQQNLKTKPIVLLSTKEE